ncbi:MAG TPA: PEP-utilizing enzyme, partial [Bdellovibrionota bacterium]|nr:PEP-utilizing enzyme [Bdellovibrionota bacterium]
AGAVRPTDPKVASGELNGTGASPGLVRGEALVIEDPRDAFKLADLSNKILVTRSTDPAWIFVMSRCAGLVSEKGSLLSHTAIVGRELGVPTVVGVQGAVLRIKSGQELVIDGRTGSVKIRS